MKKANIILLCLLVTSFLFAQEQSSPEMAGETLTAVKTDFSTLPEMISSSEVIESSTPKKATETADEIVLFCHPSIFSTEIFYTLKSMQPVEVQLVDASNTVVYKTKSEGFTVGEKLEIPAALPAGEYFLTVKGQPHKQIKLLKK